MDDEVRVVGSRALGVLGGGGAGRESVYVLCACAMYQWTGKWDYTRDDMAPQGYERPVDQEEEGEKGREDADTARCSRTNVRLEGREGWW